MAPQCYWVGRQWEKWDTQWFREWKYQGRKRNKSKIYILCAWIRIFRNSYAKGKCYLKCEFEGLIYLCLDREQGIEYAIGPKRVQLNWTCPVQGNEFQVLIDLGKIFPCQCLVRTPHWSSVSTSLNINLLLGDSSLCVISYKFPFLLKIHSFR